MKKNIVKLLIISIAILFTVLSFTNTTGEESLQRRKRPATEIEVIQTNPDGKGPQIIIEFKKGKAHNYPLLAVWIEDIEGNYIQTLYISKSIATSTFRHGEAGWGHWETAVVRRPAALPYWGHKRGLKAADGLYLPTPDNPVPDAYTGATPASNFILQSRADKKLPGQFRVLLEINQPWDWNQYWTNSKFPDDKDYKTSSQPALVYEAFVDLNQKQTEYLMKPIGHSHYSGKDGGLYTDLSTITTALNIAEKITVRIP